MRELAQRYEGHDFPSKENEVNVLLNTGAYHLDDLVEKSASLHQRIKKLRDELYNMSVCEDGWTANQFMDCCHEILLEDDELSK